MKKILILALVIMSAKMLYADEYLYDTIWNRQIPGGYQQLSADRQKVYALNTKLYSLDIKTGQIDTLTQDTVVRFSPNLQTYISYNDGKYFARRIQGNEIIKELGEFVLSSIYSQNGNYLISLKSNNTNTQHTINFYETNNFNLVHTDSFSEEASIQNTEFLSFSPNGKKFMIKSTAPNKPNTQLKYHIYEFETWKKNEFLAGGTESGYLRDDNKIVTFSEIKDIKGNITGIVPITYDTKKEDFGDWKVSNTDIYFTGYAKDLSYVFLDKHNFETKQTKRYKYPENIALARIYFCYNDTILGTGKNLLTNELSWFLLYPKIIAGVTEQNKNEITINLIDHKLTLSNPQNHQINTLTAYDILGRTYPLSANRNEVDVSTLAAGRYFLKVGLADGSFLDFSFVVE